MTTSDMVSEANSPDELKGVFGHRAKLIRLHKGYRWCTEAAAAIGILPSSLCAYENGRQLPNFETAVWIAQTYGCSLDWLAGLSEEVERQP